MKKINTFRILVIALIVLCGIMSCSEEESVVTANSTYTSSDVQRLKAEFRDIMLTNEYSTQLLNIKSLVTNLKNAGKVPIENRNDYKSWITLNISKTGYANVTVAMDAYDDLIGSVEVYTNKNSKFLNEVKNLGVKDMRYVLLEGFGVHPTSGTTSTLCEDNCMDGVESDLSDLEWDNIQDIADSENPVLTYIFQQISYWDDYQHIIDGFNDCMYGCYQ